MNVCVHRCVHLSTAGRRAFSRSSISRMSLPHSSSRSLGWRPWGSLIRPNSIHTCTHTNTSLQPPIMLQRTKISQDDSFKAIISSTTDTTREHQLSTKTIGTIISCHVFDFRAFLKTPSWEAASTWGGKQNQNKPIQSPMPQSSTHDEQRALHMVQNVSYR